LAACNAARTAPEKSVRRGDKCLKKINTILTNVKFANITKRVRLMFFDEAAFGRISEPSYCWCPLGVRPIVPCQRIREYVHVYGAFDPIYGDNCCLITPTCNTDWTNEYLRQLSLEFKNDIIVLCGDGASWHTSDKIVIPENILMIQIPPATPEMNPSEQMWKEIRKSGFKNTAFCSIKKVVDKLCDVIVNISDDVVKSVCGRDWIVSML
jgi:putative transposase